MPDAKKYTTRVPVGTTLDKQINDLLNKYHEETKIPKTKILDMAIQQYLDSKKWGNN